MAFSCENWHDKEYSMKRLCFAVALSAALATLGIVTIQAQGQNKGGKNKQKGPAPNADPYANNPDAGKLQFPLAAPAGKDSGAIKTGLPGGVNQAAVDPATWKYGPQFNAPPNSQIWNPVKAKLMAGGKVTGGTVF